MGQQSLTETQQRLLDTGKVLLVGKHSEDIPEGERDAILRGFAGNYGNRGLACTTLRDDGIVLIVTEGDVEPSVLRHEFIHAAQCNVSIETMQSALDAVITVGEPLVAAIRERMRAIPECRNDHRDLEVTERQWDMQVNGTSVLDAFVSFQFFQDLYPTKETISIAYEAIGLGYNHGVYAAMTAYLAVERGFTIDPLSDLARELVAYTFEQLDHEIIDEMMEEACRSFENNVRM